jgi:hypothetical protein
MGFTLVGRAPYEYPEMNATNPKRREPKTFVRIAHDKALAVANTYPADETGFSWDEWGDSALNEGARMVYEGVFWMYERHILFNTGGPSRKWNMRREYDGLPSKERKLYYSDVDKRIHLFNAKDGWTEIGHLIGSEKTAEVRMFDVDGDGYFDRWEYDLDNDGRPDRIGVVKDPRAHRIAFEYNELSAFYTKQVLPSAIRDDEKVIAEFQKFVKLDGSAEQRIAEMAGETKLPERKRYLLDLVREYYYQALRKKVYQISSRDPLAARSREGRESTRMEGIQSETWWTFTRDISLMDQSYAEGRYDDVIAHLKSHESILRLQE